MRNVFVPILLGSTIFITACANEAHSNSDGHHKGASGHHDNMSEQHGSNTQSSHHDGGAQHHKGMSDAEHAMNSMAGSLGKEVSVSRVINVTADDSMRFRHEPLNFKGGETIKFIVTNKGAIAHEFSIGTKGEHMKHGKMMMNNPAMHHGPGGNVLSINPGETKELIWTFEDATQIEAACNIPGHYEAGMHSSVKIGQ